MRLYLTFIRSIRIKGYEKLRVVQASTVCWLLGNLHPEMLLGGALPP